MMFLTVELSRATTQAKLALYRIATVEIPVPTLHEQQKIMELAELIIIFSFIFFQK